jgi:hypothetical protein
MSDNPPIKSPCILVCSLEPQSGYCYGCGRSGEEIAGWIDFTHEMRDKIMQELPARTAKLERKPRRITRRSRMRGDVKRRDVLDVSS